jgi:hypothetical protein
MMIKINAADIIAGAVVLVSLFKVGKNHKFWLFYAVGCLIYVVVNYFAELYGQSIMNIAAGSIAVRNFFIDKKHKDSVALISKSREIAENSKIGCNEAWWDDKIE